jgi:hypothetical protein
MRTRLWAVLLVLAATTVLAQTFRGGIRGAVTDSTGAAIPGAVVTATSAATGLVRSVVTGAQGDYVFSELPLGEWNVTASLSGFAPRTVKGVSVEAAATRRVDLVLATGAVQESVEVTASLPLIDTTHNVQGGTISGAQASELPVNGRDFTHLLTLVAGATADAGQVSDSPGSFGYFSVNGNRGRANNFLLDGTDMNDGYRNDPAINEAGVFGTPATILPIDAIQEFPVLSGAEAEYGRNSGAIVDIVTKSGTNDFHGSAFEYFRDDSLDARNYFNSKANPKSPFRNNQFGASLGGPIKKDKTFFFLAYEGQSENVGLPTLTRVPSPAELNASIAANGGVVNPVIANLLAMNPWPAPNRPPDANGNNLETTTQGTNRVDSILAKVDQHFGQSDVLTLRYFYGNSDQSFPLALVGGGNLPGYNTVTPTTVNLGSFSLTHVLSPKLLLEVRGGFNKFFETFSPEDGSFNPATIGLNTEVTNPRDFGLPTMSVSGFAPIGANSSLPRGRTDINYQAFANLSYNTGRHNWKFGYEFRRTTVDGYFDSGHRGKLSFDSLDDFVAGRVSGGSQVVGDSDRYTYENNHSFYAQDSFQAGRRITLNYGLRWDYYGVIGAQDNLFSVFDTTTATVTPVTQLYPKDWNNFSPRVSAAWDTKGDGRTVVRAGWGLYYDAYSQDFFLGQLPWNTLNPGPAYNNILFGGQPVSVLSPGTPVYSGAAATDVFTVAPNLVTPYIQNYSINVQQQLGRHAAIQLGYVGSAGRHLFRYRDLNQALPSGALPYPDFVYINQFESTANSHYNALQAIFKIRNWHGLDSTMSYTLGKSVDNASDGQDYVPQATQPDDSTRPDREVGPSNFDQRHRFTWYFTWELGKQTGHWLSSGWALNGVVTLASGMPFNPVYLYEGDYNGSDEYFGRGDIVGDPQAGTNGRDKFLNLSAFQAPCNPDGSGGCAGGQHFGSQTRNAFYGPAYKNLDLSIVKNTPLGNRVRLQIRVDFFNILNHPNFANPLLPSFAVDFLQNGIDPSTNRGTGFLPVTATPDVGTGNPYLGGGGPRNIQLAARVSF